MKQSNRYQLLQYKKSYMPTFSTAYLNLRSFSSTIVHLNNEVERDCYESKAEPLSRMASKPTRICKNGRRSSPNFFRESWLVRGTERHERRSTYTCFGNVVIPQKCCLHKHLQRRSVLYFHGFRVGAKLREERTFRSLIHLYRVLKRWGRCRPSVKHRGGKQVIACR